MPVLRVAAFDGMVPRLSATALADNQAQTAQNVKLYSQELRTWRGPLAEFTPTITNAKSIYRLYNSGGASVWLYSAAVVDYAPGPLADTSEMRIYYTGEASARKTNYALASTGGPPYPKAYQEMGVPAPSAAPTLALSPNGTGTAETRAYVFTYVNDFGSIREESAPSAAATITISPTGGGVLINGFPALPAGQYNLTARRIYRSVAGASTTSYQFVAEVPIGTASYTDTLTTAQLGDVIGTIGWLPPPTGLTGLIALPGTGALAGFVGNTVYFSQPFYPHAWPLAYGISVPYPIVAIAPLGTSVVVLTDQFPYLINGGTPGAMATQRLDFLEPCVSKATVVSNEDGVTYASPNGLVNIGPASRGLMTRNLYTRDEWQQLQLTQMKSAVLDGRYFGVFPDQTNSGKAVVLSRDDVPALSNLAIPAAAFHIDAKNARLYYVDVNDGKIYQLDADDVNPLSYEWRSKRWVLPQATIFSAMRVDAAFEQVGDTSGYNASIDAIIAANNALFASNLLGAVNEAPLNVYTVDGSILTEIPRLASNRAVSIVVYADGVPVASVMPLTLDAFRLPPFKGREIEIRVTGNINVRSIAIGTSVAELKGQQQ